MADARESDALLPMPGTSSSSLPADEAMRLKEMRKSALGGNQAAAKQAMEGPTQGGRLLSLDVVRGICMFCMTIVNNPGGDWVEGSAFEHGAWANDLTPTDFIFPTFMALMGTSSYISIHRQEAKRASRGLPPLAKDRSHWLRITKRGVSLFLVGMFLNFFDRHICDGRPFNEYRPLGVFQRLGLTYYATAVLVTLTKNPRIHAAVVVSLMAAYLGIMLGVDVPPPPGGCHGAEPCCGRGNLTAMCSAEGYIDRMVIGQYPHTYTQYQDPEGIVSSLTAVTTVILGAMFGRVLTNLTERRATAELCGTTLFIGMWSAILGLAMMYLGMPLCKKLWTPSYVFFAFGLFSLFVGLAHHVVDVINGGVVSKWLQPFRYVGLNPLAVYVVGDTCQALLDGHWFSIWAWVYRNVWTSWLPEQPATFVQAFTWAWTCTLGAAFMYKKKVFWKL